MADKIIIRIDIEPEDMPIEGSFGYDTEEENAAAVKYVRDQIDAGNPVAWCHVKVTARLGPFIACDALGGCSYASLDDLKRDLLPDMQAETLRGLRTSMKDAIKTAREATRLLPKLTRNLIPVEHEE